MKKRYLNRLSLTEKLLLAGLIPFVAALTVSTASYEPIELGYSNVQEKPENATLVSSQGFLLNGAANAKKPGRVVKVSGEGEITEKYSPGRKKQWFYDIESLAKNRTHLTTRIEDNSYSMILNQDFEVEHKTKFQAADTHDIDVLNDGKLLVAPMQKDYYEEGQKVFNDSVYVYDTETGEKTWKWRFDSEYTPPDEYPRSGWTHLNDITKVNSEIYMISPRNFDQVLFINKTSKDVIEKYTLGETGNHSILYRQHNPDVLEWSDESKTVIVADSENNRVVEYSFENRSWKKTWVAKSGLNWPRDADRLPNGNTLISDTLNHRVIEITPQGEVVWEVFVPWATYDAERLGTGEESQGPTALEMNTTGVKRISGGTVTADKKVGKSNVCGKAQSVSSVAEASVIIKRLTADTKFEKSGEKASKISSQYIPWIKPSWMSTSTFIGAPIAFAIALFLALKQWIKERR